MNEDLLAPDVIGKHYDERSPIEDELRDGQLHMWYWYGEEDQAPLAVAVNRITRKVTATLGLQPGERVLDAGCGPGETAIHMAREYGAEVVGVTISNFEVEKATSRAEAAGMHERVRFQYGDYMDLPFADGSFDAALALESLQNAPDIDKVLGELVRVLRPGGRLTLSDFSLESDAEPERIATFMTTLKLGELPTMAEWIDRVRAAGLVVEEYTQCGPRAFGMKAKYLKTAMNRRSEMADKFGDTAVGTYSQDQGFFVPRKDQIGYVILSARKPYR